MAKVKKHFTLPTVAPGLAKLVEKTPQGPGWIHEMKYDGYRILSYVKDGKVQLRTRNGLDWSDRFKKIADSLKTLTKQPLVLDGEMVVFDKNGLSSFSALQKALSDKFEAGFYYIVFDILFAHGADVRELALLERKAILGDLLKSKRDPHIRLSTYLKSHGLQAFNTACERNLEGLISKEIDSSYPSSRNGAWVKTKCRHEEEFVVCGYTDPTGTRDGFGALLLGYWKNKKLIYCGRVGTGFNTKTLKSIFKQLKPAQIANSIFSNQLDWKERKGVHYIRPEKVAQIKYTEWTPDGRLRHPVFLGLRLDKQATQVDGAA